LLLLLFNFVVCWFVLVNTFWLLVLDWFSLFCCLIAIAVVTISLLLRCYRGAVIIRCVVRCVDRCLDRCCCDLLLLTRVSFGSVRSDGSYVSGDLVIS